MAEQPNGTKFAVRLWGDEYAHWWEIVSTGHTVLKHPTSGYWEYAVRDASGRLRLSGVVPGLSPAPAGPRLRPSADYVRGRRRAMNAFSDGAGGGTSSSPIMGAPPAWSGVGTRLLFIMVAFSDLGCTFTPAQMQANLFGNTASGTGNLAEYYSEVSLGRLQLQGTVVGANGAQTACVTLANNRAHYNSGPGSSDTLAAEAIAAIDANFDFAPFDNDNNGFIDELGLIYAGGGLHDGCTGVDAGAGGSGGDDLWPHSGDHPGVAADTKTSNHHIINSEVTYAIATGSGVAGANCTQIQTIGLFAHEFGHSLGLPDLYDTDSSSAGVGRWSTMASQYSSLVNNADSPTHFDPWSKWFLGWITPIDYTGMDTGVNLDQVEDSGMVAQFLANPGGAERGGSGEYFLVENRQQVRFDAQLPGCGILVWHLDEAKSENTDEGHTAATHRLVDIERANGTLSTDDPDNINTAGIPFPGSSNNTLFADTTTPTARLYSGTASEVRVSVVGGCSASMAVNFGNPAADLVLSKSDSPDPVVAGTQLDYLLTVTNNGPGTATNVVVTDVLPAGVVYLANSDTCTNTSGTLSCDLGTLAPSAISSFTVQVQVPANHLSSIPASTANLTNTAEVEADEPDGHLADNSVTVTTNVTESADLRVLKDCKPDPPGTQAAGTAAFCEIYVDNVGPSDARTVVITDRIISSVNHTVSAIETTGTGLSCSASPLGGTATTTRTITCTDAVLPAGARDTIRITFTALATGDVNNTATASSATPDPDDTNNASTDGVTFGGAADLALTKNGIPNPVVAGTNLTYNFTVTNNGPSTAVNVRVTDLLPATLSIVSVNAGAPSSCNAGVPGSVPTTCTFDSVASGISRTMTIVALVSPSVPADTVLSNNATVSSDTTDSNNSNNLATTSTTVNASANLSIVKGDTPNPVIAGANLSYVLTIANAGPSWARAVVVTDSLPAAVTFLGATIAGGSGTCVPLAGSPTVVQCTLGDIANGDTRVVTIQTRVSPSVPNGTVINNVATVSSPTPDPAAGNNTAGASTTVNAQADIWVDKTGVQITGNPSRTIRYTLAVYNKAGCEADDPLSCGTGGPSDAQNVVVTDTLPLDPKKVKVVFVSAGCTYSPTPAPHKVVCNVAGGVLPAGQTATFIIDIQVAGSVGNFTNNVSVATTTVDPNSANNTDQLKMIVKGGTARPGQ